MTSRKHVIVGTTKGGLGSTRFSPRNSLPTATRPFGDTVVSIAARSQILKLEHFLAPQFNVTVDLAILGEVS
jgi:hypothetical protein